MENQVTFSAKCALHCAADSMETLRKCDVERVVETAWRNGSFFNVVAWIKNERPDLNEVLQLAVNKIKKEKF